MPDKSIHTFGIVKGIGLGDPLQVTLLNFENFSLPAAVGEVDLRIFKNLTGVGIANTLFTKLNLACLTKLTSFDASGYMNPAAITSLDITGCTGITLITLSGCTSLTSLIGLNTCVNVTSIGASPASLLTLDITGCIKVINYNAGNFYGTTLILTDAQLNGVAPGMNDTLRTVIVKKTNVTTLYAQSIGTFDHITSIDISDCTGLTILEAYGLSYLQSIVGLSALVDLTKLYVQGDVALTALDISNSANITDLDAGQCTGLAPNKITLHATGAKMKNVDLADIGLNYTAVDDVLAKCVAGGVKGGQLDLSGNAAPSVLGLADKATLEALVPAWSVTVAS